MKLSALITESSNEQWNSKLESIILSRGSNTTAEEISKFQQVLDKVAELTKFKVLNIKDIGHHSILITLSNGLLDANLILYSSDKDQVANYGGLKIYLTLNDSVRLPRNNKYDSPSTGELITGLKFADNPEGIEETVQQIVEYIEDFNKWYFEMSGEFGQVKLFVTAYNIIDGYHQGGDKRIVAYAGDFIKSDGITKAEVYK